MGFLQVIAGLCVLYTGIALISLTWDIVKLPWSLFRGKPVTFFSTDYLKNRRDWTEALIFAAVFIVGLVGLYTMLPGWNVDSYTAEEMDQSYEDGYDYALRDYIDCPYCGEGFPERLAYETGDGDTICPECIRDDFDALMNGEILRCHNCSSFYFPSDSDGFGLCYDCCNKYISDCSNCSAYTYRWGADGFYLCPDCAGAAFNDPTVARAIERWHDG